MITPRVSGVNSRTTNRALRREGGTNSGRMRGEYPSFLSSDQLLLAALVVVVSLSANDVTESCMAIYTPVDALPSLSYSNFDR